MSGWPHLVAGRGTEKSWSGDRQTDGLMQASDELRCSGMTIGAFSFSDDGGSERPRRRTRQLQRNGRDSGAAGSGRR